MPKFQYKAKNISGSIIEGVYEAPNRQSVVEMMKQQSYYILEINPIIERKDLMDLSSYKKIPIKELMVFCRQFSLILKAGIPMIHALDMLSMQAESPVLKKIIIDLMKDIQTGSSLTQALQVHEKRLPAILIYMVEAGEYSGTLEKSLETMALHFEKSFKLQKKIKAALRYPVLISIVAVAVVAFLMAVVVPTFVDLFQGQGEKLPLPTRILVGISDFIIHFGFLVIAFILVAGLLFHIYIKTEEGRLKFDKRKFAIPIIGSLIRKTVASRFARTMATLMSSGVGITDSLDITARVVGNAYARYCLENIRKQVISGKGLYQPLKATKLFPTMLENMIMMGEETGSLEGMLLNAAEFFEEEIDSTADKVTGMMEPIIIVFLAGVVGFIVIAVAMPMFNMATLV